jgi:ribosomal protein S18 acetylase RimI-like enzyme
MIDTSHKPHEDALSNRQFATRCYPAVFEFLGLPVGTTYGCTFAETGIASALLNGIFHYDCPEATEEQAVTELTAYYQMRNLPHMWLIPTDRVQEKLKERLGQKNLYFQGNFFCMNLDASDYEAPKELDGLIIKQVTDEGLFTAWAKLVGPNFGMDELLTTAYANLLLQGGLACPFYHLAGFYRDMLVSTASVLIDTRGAYIYNLSTLSDYRRKGIASHMMKRCIELASQNSCTRYALISSNEAKALYTKQGFKTIETYEVYM